MDYLEYKKILEEAMVFYVNSGGSVYHMTEVIREYFFSYDNEPLSEDAKSRLENRAVQAINNMQPLPPGTERIDNEKSYSDNKRFFRKRSNYGL